MVEERYLIIFLLVHVVLCIVLVILNKLKILHIPRRNLLLAVLLPIWGGVMALFAQMYLKQGKAGMNEKRLPELEEEKNVMIRRHLSPEETMDDRVVPLEEALILEDPTIRRDLILEIVQEDPKLYVSLLKKVQLGNDTEVSHYASTAIMEVQRHYETSLRQRERAIKGESISKDHVQSYVDLLNEYIHSGLLSDNVLNAHRKKLNTFYVSLLSEYEVTKDVYRDAIDNLIELNDYMAAESLLMDADVEWEQDEAFILLKLKLFHKTKNRWALRKEIQTAKDSGMYLSPETREVIEFWSERA